MKNAVELLKHCEIKTLDGQIILPKAQEEKECLAKGIDKYLELIDNNSMELPEATLAEFKEIVKKALKRIQNKVGHSDADTILIHAEIVLCGKEQSE